MARSIALLACLLMLALSAPKSIAQIYEPARGSAERKAMLDVVRPVVERETRGPVDFVVTKLDVMTPWGFAVLEPQRPGGAQIDLRSIGLDPDFYDGLTTYALLRERGGRWRLIDFAIGPTDVFFAAWPDQFGVPAALLGLQ